VDNEFEQQADEVLDLDNELEVDDVDEGYEDDASEDVEFESEDDEEEADEASYEDQDEEGSPPVEDQDNNGKKNWVTEVRRKHRELERENRELKQKMQSLEQPKQEVLQLPPEPELSDYDWDEADYKKAVHEWYSIKAKVDQQKAVEEQKAQMQQYEQTKKFDDYNKAKASFDKREFDESEFIATTLLTVPQQNMLLQYSDDPAALVYKLGKNHKDIKKLSDIQDPIMFIKELAKTEERMKAVKVNKAAAPKAESGIPRKSGGGTGGINSNLDRLRQKAEQTGDYTAYFAARRSTKNKN
jgi:hypothetical protein